MAISHQRNQRIQDAEGRLNGSILKTLDEWLRTCDGTAITEIACLLENARTGYRGTVHDLIKAEIQKGESV